MTLIVVVFSLCSSLTQFVCHMIQRLQTCGEPRIHPSLIWTSTGMCHSVTYTNSFFFFCAVCKSRLFKTTPSVFSRLVDIKITFQLKGINLQTVRSRELPDCYLFSVTVSSYYLFILNSIKQVQYMILSIIVLKKSNSVIFLLALSSDHIW